MEQPITQFELQALTPDQMQSTSGGDIDISLFSGRVRLHIDSTEYQINLSF